MIDLVSNLQFILNNYLYQKMIRSRFTLQHNQNAGFILSYILGSCNAIQFGLIATLDSFIYTKT